VTVAAVTSEIFAGPIMIVPPYVTFENAFRKTTTGYGIPKLEFEEKFAT